MDQDLPRIPVAEYAARMEEAQEKIREKGVELILARLLRILGS